MREEGPSSLYFKTLGELGYRRVIVFERDLTQRQKERAAPAGVRLELVCAANLADFSTLSGGCGEAEARRRLADGHIGLLGYFHGRPTHCSWLALGSQPVAIDFLQIEVELAPRSAYTYEVYVDAACRGSGLARAGLEARVRLLRERGVERLIGVVMPENRDGWRHTLACGLRPVGRIHRVRAMGFNRCRLSTDVDPPPLRVLSADEANALRGARGRLGIELDGIDV